MGKIYSSVTELIGGTPLVELRNLEEREHLYARVLLKLEGRNPAGSVKDRAALAMLDDAVARGLLKPGGTIVEPTSGNTGIALCAIAAARGYRCVIVMPDSMSPERRKLMEAYGAELVLTPGQAGMAGAMARAKTWQEEHPGSFLPGQFENPANPQAHYRSTGPEIWTDTGGKVDILVAGIGTGGTISGAGRYLKEKNRKIRVVGVEPAEAPVLTRGQGGSHGIPGIGPGFVPENLDREILDEVATVKTADAVSTGRRLTREEGLPVGISAGAAVWEALRLAALSENAGKMIVVIGPDGSDRYYSTPLFAQS